MQFYRDYLSAFFIKVKDSLKDIGDGKGFYTTKFRYGLKSALRGLFGRKVEAFYLGNAEIAVFVDIHYEGNIMGG
jgi:hypothetical protein